MSAAEGESWPRREVPQDPAISPGDGLAEAVRIEDVPDGSLRLLITDPARSGCCNPLEAAGEETGSRRCVGRGDLAGARRRRAARAPGDPRAVRTSKGWRKRRRRPISPVATFSVSAAAARRPSVGAMEPAQLIGKTRVRAFASAVSGASRMSRCPRRLKRKAEAIHKSGRGTVFSLGRRDESDVAAIEFGGRILEVAPGRRLLARGTAEPEAPSRYSLLGVGQDGSRRWRQPAKGGCATLARRRQHTRWCLMPFGLRGALDDAHVSPLMTKLYQESGLRRLTIRPTSIPRQPLPSDCPTGRAHSSRRRPARSASRYDSIPVSCRGHPGRARPFGRMKEGGGAGTAKSVLEICEPGHESGELRARRCGRHRLHE